MNALLRRLRSSGGPLLQLALLAGVAAVLLTGGPRWVNGLTDASLREQVAPLGTSVRDVTFHTTSDRLTDPSAQAAERLLEHTLRDELAPPLRSRVERSWWTAELAPDEAGATGSPFPVQTQFGVLTVGGWTAPVVEGRLPAPPEPAGIDERQRIEVAVSSRTVDLFAAACGDCGFGVGSRFLLPGRPGDGGFRAVVVGIVELDPADPTWQAQPLVVEGIAPREDGDPYRASFLADPAAAQALVNNGRVLDHGWRYRIDVDRLDVDAVPRIRDAVAAARATPGFTLQTALDGVLVRFTDDLAATRALLTVVPASLLAVMAGLALLASALMVRRRSDELALLRGRGASLVGIARHTATETVPLVAAGAALGVAAGLLVPGRPGGTLPVLLGFALLAAGAVPALAVAAVRQPGAAAGRDDLVTGRPGPRRMVAEAALVALAALGAWLVRRRGLTSADGDVDLFLAAVPVLLGCAAAVLVLRAVPPVLGGAGRLAAAGRGVVGFVGLARAGRAAGAVVGPVAVLVVAVSVVGFSVTLAGAVEDSRDRAAALEAVGDLTLEGASFDARTTDRLAAVPGTAAVAAYVGTPGTSVRPVDQPRPLPLPVRQLVVDVPRLAAVAESAGRDLAFPPVLVDARPDEAGAVPVLVSPDLAEALDGEELVTRVGGVSRTLRIAGVVERFPALPRTAETFLVVPAQALDDADSLAPNGFVLAGSPDPAALVEVAQEGHRAWLDSVGVDSDGVTADLRTVSHAERRAALADAELNEVFTATYVLGAVDGGLLALLAIGAAVLTGAPQRGVELSRLRTLGLARGQGRRLLLVEVSPLVLVGVLTGSVVGVLLPRLLEPVLRLTAFTDGFPVRPGIPLVVAALALALVGAGLALALVVEALFNRRQRLGETLRLGRE